MSPIFQLGIYCVSGIAVTVLCPHIVFAFVFAVLLAYVAQPFVVQMERITKIPRAVLIAMLLLTLLWLLCLCVMYGIPALYQQTMLFVPMIPMYLGALREKIVSLFGAQSKILDNGFVEHLSSLVDNFNNEMVNLGVQYLDSIVHYTFATINCVVTLILIPVLFFYYAKDFDSIGRSFIASLPHQYRGQIHKFLCQLGYTINAYIKSQFSVCIILLIYYSIGLSIIGVNFPLLVATISALSVIIPIIGYLLALMLALPICYFDYGATSTLLYTAILYMLGYGIETWIITPRIIGSAMKLHPLLLLFGTMIFGSLFGVLGLILAMPSIVVLSVVVKFIWQADNLSTIDVKQTD